jgi:hypothetical protein
MDESYLKKMGVKLFEPSLFHILKKISTTLYDVTHVYFCVGDQVTFNSLFMFSVFLPSFPIPKCGQKINFFYNEILIGYNNLEETCGFQVQNLTIFAKSQVKGY